MASLVSELIVSVDGCAKGERSPGYYGYFGPEFAAWMKEKSEEPFRQLMGRKTYELLNALPEKDRDEEWEKMANRPGYVVSKTMKTCEWPGLEIVSTDLLDFVRDHKRGRGPELRIAGSLSLVRQFAAAGLLDVLRLMVCPLALPESGAEPVFDGHKDTKFDLLSSKVLDGRVLINEYRPNGAIPTRNLPPKT